MSDHGKSSAISSDRFESLLQELLHTERSYVRRIDTLYQVCSTFHSDYIGHVGIGMLILSDSVLLLAVCCAITTAGKGQGHSHHSPL